MFDLLTGALLLSLLHALIPNHWAPVLAVARAERWTLGRVVGVTVAAGLAHVAGTVALGVGLGLVGWRLSARFTQFAEVVAPVLLIGLGVAYALSGRGHTHPDPSPVAPRRPGRVVMGLAATMFLAPCLEIQTFFLATGARGPLTLALVAAAYLLVTVAAMTALVAAAYGGLRHLRLSFLTRHERQLTGLVLVLVGVAGFFLDW